MLWNRRNKGLASFRSLHILIGVFVLMAILLPSATTAKAAPSWCVRELERTDKHIVVLHNPDCDLRVLPRMYPQKDDDGNVLPMQQQLRSLFAANQTRVEDGNKRRFTVMRGCVRPGKPSQHADAEELQVCPDGLMNYFSAPAADSAARIIVPVKRHLTVAEHNLAVAKSACEQLQKLPTLDTQAEKAVENCKKEFKDMVFTAGATAPAVPKGPTSPVDNEKLQKLQKQNADLHAKLVTVVPQANKAKFVGPLFIVLFGLAVIGATSIIVALKTRRDKKLVEAKHAVLAKERSAVKEIVRAEVVVDYKKQLAATRGKVEEELRLAWNNLLTKRQKENNQLTEDNKKLRERIEELSAQIKDFRESIVPPPINTADAIKPQSKDAEQLRIIDNQAGEIRALKRALAEKEWQNNDLAEHVAGMSQRVEELVGESTALTREHATLELASKHLDSENARLRNESEQIHAKARDANRDKVIAEERVAELEEAVRERDQDSAGLRQQISAHEAAASQAAEKIKFLNLRITQLVHADSVSDVKSDADLMKQTLQGPPPHRLAARIDDDTLVPDDAGMNTKPNVEQEPEGQQPGSAYSYRLDEAEDHAIPSSIGTARGADERRMPEAWDRGVDELTHPCDETEYEKRVSDSVRPQPGENPEDVDFSRLAEDDDEPRDEMPTLSEADGVTQELVENEQRIHYHKEWFKLVQLMARKVVPELKLDMHSNTEQTFLTLEAGLQDLHSNHARLSQRLKDAEFERDNQKAARDKNAKHIERLEADLRQREVELASAQEIAGALRRENDGMTEIINVKGDNLQRKLYAYQLAIAKAEQRALKAEKARQVSSEQLSQAQGEIASRDRAIALQTEQIAALEQSKGELESRFTTVSKTEGIPTWSSEERKTDSGLGPDLNQAKQVSTVLGLGDKDRLPAREVLARLPQEELLRLASSVFYAVAEHIRGGEVLELPIGEMADLYALHDVANVPLVSIYGFNMPQTLQNIAGQGTPRLYHTMHESIRRPEDVSEVPSSMMTMPPPPAGVPADRNSSPPPPDNSVVRTRAAICPPPGQKDGKSRSMP